MSYRDESISRLSATVLVTVKPDRRICCNTMKPYMKVVSVSILQLRSWTLRLGRRRTEPESLEAALGQKLTPDDAQKCFSCHATNAVSETQELRLEGLTPGIGCEACHGPAAAHVEAAKAGQSKTDGVFFSCENWPGMNSRSDSAAVATEVMKK